MKKEILRMEQVNITGDLTDILNNFRLNIYEGELVNLIGLSGAGKTLLLNFFNGNITIKSGRVLFNKKEYRSGDCFSPNQKIICIGQESSLLVKMTVAENIFVLSRKKKGLWFSNKQIEYQAKLLLSEYAPDINPSTIVDELSIFQQHLISILRAIVNEASLVIIDNVFQSYGYHEIISIKKLIHRLKEKKIAVLYESQKIDFLHDITDRIIILRKGVNVRTFYPEDYDENLCNLLLIGNEIPNSFVHTSYIRNEPLLTLKDYFCDNMKTKFNLMLNKGEIIGLYDKENKKNVELALSLLGESKEYTGTIKYKDLTYTPKGLDNAINHGIGYMPRNMIDVSLINEMSYKENLYLPIMKKTSKAFIFNDPSIEKYLGKKYMKYLGISMKQMDNEVQTFDKYIYNNILLTRWIVFRPALMICIEPCSRADILMQNLIYSAFELIVKDGGSIIITASDLNELYPICDRIFVLNKDKITQV